LSVAGLMVSALPVKYSRGCFVPSLSISQAEAK
jgi:hypothetical protein